MRLAALAAAAVLAPTVADAPPRGPETVTVSVGHERASGFVADDGRVVTVAHVLSGHEPVAVDGRPATVVRLDRRNDLALLRVPGVEGDAPRLGGGDGDSRVLGRPAQVVRRIAARMDGGPPRPALEVRAKVAAGDSGAPIVTDGGRITGVIFARSRTRARTAYAVDATAVASLLR
jgi:S1-C subfamily serine protease